MSKHSLWVVAIVLMGPSPPLRALPAGKHFTNSTGMKLVRIEPGHFVMGTGGAPPRSREEWERYDWDEAPAHRVRVSRPFYLGVHEVTNAEYERFDPGHRKQRGKSGASREDSEPVTHVTWGEAVRFCEWLSKKEGRPYRLPTEAEWEYACRAGTTTAFHTGDTLTAEDANIAPPGGKKASVRAVGSYRPNAWGLHDMHGNAAEWCHDWYGPYEAGERTDPVGRADGEARVVRGWSYLAAGRQVTRYCRSANRSGHLPEDANRYTGFRVVLGEMPAGAPSPVIVPATQKDVVQKAQAGPGPDPDRPYFVGYTRQGKAPTIPENSWGPLFSQWSHFTAVCVCPNGDVLGVWYNTVSEAGRELCLAASRLRAGSDRWEPTSSFFDVPDVNDHAPVLFCDGERVYHFCLQALHGWDYASIVMRVSDDSGGTWSRPRIILSRDAENPLSQPCSAFRHRGGTLLLACDGDGHRRERLLRSDDGGKTWQVGKGDFREALGKRYVIHPAIAPADDGSVLAFLRGPDPMPLFRSRDLGESWEVTTTPLPGIGVGQKTAVLRLKGGGLLLCSTDSRKRLVGGTYAALSLDNGKTWSHVRPVEGVRGYLSVAQAPNGVIYLCGSLQRGAAALTCAAFNRAWLEEGKPVGELLKPGE